MMTELGKALIETFDRRGIMYLKQAREELQRLGLKDLQECGISLDDENLDRVFIERCEDLTSEAELVYFEHKHKRKGLPDIKIVTEPVNGNLIIYTLNKCGEVQQELITVAKQQRPRYREWAGFCVIDKNLSYTFQGDPEVRGHIEGFENHSPADIEKIIEKTLELAGFKF
ncbi:MAG: hypothetical protein KAT77_03590 [Nanoarchaeota archaeon]|nr:hypothetical protein [Nanoarchaeota archaeon]